MATQQNSPGQPATLQNNKGLIQLNDPLIADLYIPDAGFRSNELMTNLVHVKFFVFDAAPPPPCSNVQYLGDDWTGTFICPATNYYVSDADGYIQLLHGANPFYFFNQSISYDAMLDETVYIPISTDDIQIKIYSTTNGQGTANPAQLIYTGSLTGAIGSFFFLQDGALNQYSYTFDGNCPNLIYSSPGGYDPSPG